MLCEPFDKQVRLPVHRVGQLKRVSPDISKHQFRQRFVLPTRIKRQFFKNPKPNCRPFDRLAGHSVDHFTLDRLKIGGFALNVAGFSLLGLVVRRRRRGLFRSGFWIVVRVQGKVRRDAQRPDHN